MWADTILIVFISVCTALLGEGTERFLVSRIRGYIPRFRVIVVPCNFHVTSRSDMANGLQNGEVSETESRSRETE